MKKVLYSPTLDSVALGDARVEIEARAFLSGARERIEVSNELFLLAVRVLVHEGVFPHDQVVFVMPDETTVTLDIWGRTPAVFDDIASDLLMRMLAPKPQHSPEGT